MKKLDLECNLREFKRKVESAPQPLVLKTYVLGWADKCLKDGIPKNKKEAKGSSKGSKKKSKRAPSAYNQFIGECMKGCGNNTQPCSERMKDCAIEWKQKKK